MISKSFEKYFLSEKETLQPYSINWYYKSRGVLQRLCCGKRWRKGAHLPTQNIPFQLVFFLAHSHHLTTLGLVAALWMPAQPESPTDTLLKF
ncbi:hypothetical protein BJY00DRAFT_274412 [Aspergillus carlsbadensis]|nr:hypothetical protein BJY00DRAFT_274412 [Aspergillus carlsbadensis]